MAGQLVFIISCNYRHDYDESVFFLSPHRLRDGYGQVRLTVWLPCKPLKAH